MKNLTIETIAKACNGQIHSFGHEIKNDEAKCVVIDSRLICDGGVFIATKGEKVDGHSFIGQVFEKGALCVICEVLPESAEGVCILVNDSFKALKDIALFYRMQLSIKFVGVTGSVGKTTTKEMIASVLSEQYNVLYTQGNYNNEIGVPLTLLRIRDEHEVAVVEMGINSFGEMTRLSEMVKPDICVITNIGECHLEKLIDRDGVLKAKTEIFNYLNREGFAVLCGDDDKLITVKDVYGKAPVLFGIENENVSYRAVNVKNHGLLGSSFTIKGHDIKDIDISLSIPGKHMITNSVAATAIGRILSMSEDKIKEGLEKCKALSGRNELHRLKDMIVIDDCYNANPTSTKAGIDLLSMSEGLKVAVLGDMLELGENTEELHASVGAYAVEKGVNRLICIGTISKAMYDEALKMGMPEDNLFYYESSDEAAEKIEEYVLCGSTVLIKASHGTKLEKVLKAYLDRDEA